MNIFDPMKNLLKQAFSFRRYKGMPLPMQIIVGILLCPLWLIALSFVACYYFAALLVTLFNYPIDALLGFVKKEGGEVHPATQVVVYLFGWPLILFFKVAVIYWTIVNYILYFFATCFFYLATLAGVEFDLKLDAIERNMEKEERNRAAIFKGIIFLVFSSVSAFNLLLGLLFFILSLVGVPFIVALIFFGIALLSDTLKMVWIVLAWGTHLFDRMNEVKIKKEMEEEVLAEEEEHIEEEPEIKVEEEVSNEEIVVNEEETSAEESVATEEKKEEHFDFSSLDEYSKNRRPADDYQAERLDDLDDDYDRR